MAPPPPIETHRALRRALAPLAVVCGVTLAACPEPVPGPFVIEPDAAVFFDSGFFSDASFDSGGGAISYHPTVRLMLARCVGCHGADGPIAPPLHSYVAARNATDDIRRKLTTGHIGDYSRLQPGCGALSEETPEMFIVTLDGALQSWRSGGFPAGVPSGEEAAPPPPPAPAHHTASPIPSVTPRCYRLGSLAGDVERVAVSARGLAWVEIYAVAPALEPSLSALESADAAAGWTCDADLALVPQPLVWAWQLGDADADLTQMPVRVGPGSTLVARVDTDFLPTPVEGPSLDVAFWFDDGTTPAQTFMPLWTTSSLVLPWLATEAELVLMSVYSSPTVGQLRVLGEDDEALCLHARNTASDWPELTTRPPGGTPLVEGDRLELDCVAGACAAQVGLAGVQRPEPCGPITAACVEGCGADLDCTWSCAEEAGGRCALSLLMGQLACRSHTCPDTIGNAHDRLEACTANADPAACVSDMVLPLLDGCGPGPFCDAALNACMPIDG